MAEQSFDLVVLGGGTGGYVAAIRAAQLGLSVAIVEKDKLGGTCLHRGCIPSKALLRSAELFADVKNGENYGVSAEKVSFHLEHAMERKQSIVEKLHRGVEFLMKKNRVEVIRGYGRLMGPSIFSPQAGAVRVENGEESQILTPRFTLIATGSSPRALPDLPFDGKLVLSSDDALQFERLPNSILIVGGGAIGVEWASMLSDFGVQVTLLEFLPRLLPQEDEEVSREVEKILKKRGVAVQTGAKVIPDSFRKQNDGMEIQYDLDGQQISIQADCMMVAVGRSANVDNLGIEATEIEIQRGVIQVDEHYRTREHNIFAIGDVIGGLQLAHVAAHEGIHAVETMAGLHTHPLVYRNIARCTYSRPEVASVGWTESEAKEAGYQLKIGKFPFSSIGKALVHGEAEGFVKMIADRETDDLLGVHIVGPHATDLISEAGLALFVNASAWEIGNMIHPHPTLSETLGEAALAVDGLALHM